MSVETIPEHLRTVVPVLVERAGETFTATVLPAAVNAAQLAAEAVNAAAPHVRRAVDVAVDRGAELASAAASSDAARELRRRAAGAAAAAMGEVPLTPGRSRWALVGAFAAGAAAGAAVVGVSRRQLLPVPVSPPIAATPDALIDPPDPLSDTPGDAGD